MISKIGRRKLFSKAKPKKPRKTKLESLEETGELLADLRDAVEHWGKDQNSEETKQEATKDLSLFWWYVFTRVIPIAFALGLASLVGITLYHAVKNAWPGL